MNSELDLFADVNPPPGVREASLTAGGRPAGGLEVRREDVRPGVREASLTAGGRPAGGFERRREGRTTVSFGLAGCTLGPASESERGSCTRSANATFESIFEASTRALRACAAFALNAALPILTELALAFSCCCLNLSSSFFAAASSGLSRNPASPTCTDP